MEIICGDCREVLKTLLDNSIDSVVTDPPYELGFMSKGWDKTGIAYNVDLWREVLRVLKPGGHLLSFGGTRTYHRMVCAIEDAGFEIRDMIEWVYSQGFPKSLDISKAIDKKAGSIRKIIGQRPIAYPDSDCWGVPNKNSSGENPNPSSYKVPTEKDGGNFGGMRNITAPSTPEAKLWEGYGTGLKPAHEPICLARKPLSEKTIAENVLKWGTGAINIDGCRIMYQGSHDYDEYVKKRHSFDSQIGKIQTRENTNIPFMSSPSANRIQTKGRFPANFIHDGSDEVMELFPNSSITGKRKDPSKGYHQPEGGEWFGRKNHNGKEYTDSGSAARFFKTCKRFLYTAKASRAERDAGLEDMLSPEENLQGLDTRGRTLIRADGTPTLVERWQPNKARVNNHPTVKPLALMRYLIKLITPPRGTILDPLCGSGSTLIAAKQLGFDYIGIELNEDYCNIARKRLDATNKDSRQLKRRV